MSATMLFFRIAQAFSPVSEFSYEFGAIVLGGLLLALLTWFGQNAIKNHDTPRRIGDVEKDIRSMKQDVSDMKSDISAMKVSLGYIEEQNKQIIDRLDRSWQAGASSS